MAVTLQQIEGLPDAWPVPPDIVLSPAAAALDPAVIWARLETYICYRWQVRDVEWTVEGCGEWLPPLQPAVITGVTIWDDDTQWTPCNPVPSPRGYALKGFGPYRFAGTVGGDEKPPAVIAEAWRRLAEYLAAPSVNGAVSGVAAISYGPMSISYHRRSAAYAATALQNSGAADLLRAYRIPLHVVA